MNMARKQILVFLALAALAAPASAVDGGAVLGGAIGGGIGAGVGSAVGGTEGAIIGGAIGGAAGAAIATSGGKETKVVTKEVVVEKEVVYVNGRHDNGLHRGHHKDKHDHH
jgi:outer membrane lipoprotein SlyB